MVKQYLLLFITLTVGILGGMLLTGEDTSTPAANSSITTKTDESPAYSPASQAPEGASRLAELEDQVMVLKQRISELEQLIVAPPLLTTTEQLDDPQVPVVRGNRSFPVVDSLVAAGLDEYTARDIAQRQSEVELKRLQLRDTAIREGYIGTQQFRDEITQLREQEVRVRDEIDEESYDKYLYYTGQPNRVAVTSVLLGSAAEESGIQEGDFILRYEDERLYSGRDLRSATIKGEKDELVDVTVQRGDSEFIVSVPRGPLGVRMSPVTINPENPD